MNLLYRANLQRGSTKTGPPAHILSSSLTQPAGWGRSLWTQGFCCGRDALLLVYLLCLKSCIDFIFFFFLAVPPGIWDLGSPTKDRTCSPCSASVVLTTGLPGKPSSSTFFQNKQESKLVGGKTLRQEVGPRGRERVLTLQRILTVPAARTWPPYKMAKAGSWRLGTPVP